jgi:predicted ester cyclase
LSIEQNKALVQRFIDEVLNAGNVDVISDLCVEGSMFAGGLVGQMKAMRTPFPDLHLAVDSMIAEGNQVAARVTIQGTNDGPLVGLPAFGRLESPVPPTGKSVMHGGIYVFTIADGRIVSYAAEYDHVGMLQQLGWTLTPPGQQ